LYPGSSSSEKLKDENFTKMMEGNQQIAREGIDGLLPTGRPR